MSYDVINGELQPKKPQLMLTGQQLASMVLMERRIAELNNDALVYKQMGAPALAKASEEATVVLAKAHQDYLAETQRAVKLADPADLPKLVG